MVAVHKLEVYVVDFDGLGVKETQLLIEQALNRYSLVRFGKNVVLKLIPDWDDKNPMNFDDNDPAVVFEQLGRTTGT